jgi:hypothetical protein
LARWQFITRGEGGASWLVRDVMDKATEKHRKALQDYKRALDYDRENREAALDDSAFVAGRTMAG